MIRGRRLLFAIPYQAVAAVEIGSNKTRHFSISTVTGRKFSFKSDFGWIASEKWVAVLAKLVISITPEREPVVEGRITKFSPKNA